MKKAVKIVAFLLALMLCYSVVNQVLMIKTDDMVSMIKYRELPPDTVDVLMVGSSHVGMNIDNQRIFDEYGIASYNLWVGMQPLWNSYYYVKEGLKYQTPDVVLVDVFLAGTAADDSTNTVALKNIQLLPFGMDKINAAFASYHTWQDALEAVWGFPYYHERFDELVADDFDMQYGKNDLTLPAPRQVEGVVTALDMLDYSAITDTLALTEKNEKYLHKLITLCKQKNIELVLVTSPFEASEEEAKRFNEIERIANEEGVVFLNYLKTYDVEGIDANTDFYNRGHLNNVGIEKYSDIIGRYLSENYDLRDCRYVEGHVWNKEHNVQQQADTLVYALQKVFQGDGQSESLDTGVKLYGNRYASWTMLVKVGLPLPDENEGQVILSCFDEQNRTSYHGLLMRGDGGAIQLVLGNNRAYLLRSENAEEAIIAIVKENEQYTVYFNGEKVITNESLPCDAYEGTLLLGCQELSPGGEKFRFSPTRVLNLEVYDSVLSSDEILAWQPEDLPEAERALGVGQKEASAVYTLQEQFIGGLEGYRQGEYLDTQMQLFETPATRFTLLTSIVPTEASAGGVFLSCFDETVGEYRGLIIRQLDNAQINIVFGQNVGVIVPGTLDKEMQIAIVKNGSKYQIYADGVLVSEVESATKSYDGTLLLGAQRDAEGNIFRISKTQVKHLSVFAGVMTEEEVQAWTYPEAEMPKPLVAESSAYQMPSGFLGNGQDRALDTGVKLFDISTKDWTLDTVLDVRKGVNNGVYMSCFSEEAGRYRGFMIRQNDAESLTVFVGNCDTITLDIPSGASQMHLVLVKSGNVYTLFCDGQLVEQVESACDNYDATLILGAQRDADGNLFRFSNAGVQKLTITDEVLSEEEAAQQSMPLENKKRF